MVNKLFPEERLEQLYKIIQEEKKVRVNDVSTRFSMSRSTIRTDLEELESRGLIVRTHGGQYYTAVTLKIMITTSYLKLG
jgi:DeoR/GlpR family transcriptional regulator of sugar metabolism